VVQIDHPLPCAYHERGQIATGISGNVSVGVIPLRVLTEAVGLGSSLYEAYLLGAGDSRAPEDEMQRIGAEQDCLDHLAAVVAVEDAVDAVGVFGGNVLERFGGHRLSFCTGE